MPHSIAVSVVIPAYNAAEFLPDSLASVFRQTYQPQEVLIVDDGSEDETSRVAQALEKRVRYLRKPRGGPASARNLGIRAAQGEWIAFLDADDIWLPDMLCSLAAAMRAAPGSGHGERARARRRGRVFDCAHGALRR